MVTVKLKSNIVFRKLHMHIFKQFLYENFSMFSLYFFLIFESEEQKPLYNKIHKNNYIFIYILF